MHQFWSIIQVKKILYIAYIGGHRWKGEMNEYKNEEESIFVASFMIQMGK